MTKNLSHPTGSKNLVFFIITIFATLTFMMQISNAVDMAKDNGGTINSVRYTIFQLKLCVTQNSCSKVNSIPNYPLIPISGGIIYNLFIMIKNYVVKKINT